MPASIQEAFPEFARLENQSHVGKSICESEGASRSKGAGAMERERGIEQRKKRKREKQREREQERENSRINSSRVMIFLSLLLTRCGSLALPYPPTLVFSLSLFFSCCRARALASATQDETRRAFLKWLRLHGEGFQKVFICMYMFEFVRVDV